ncbi:MAG: FtsQ-type POTRA domain-containing protein [Desulfatitalea sp.]|nr:FtsQ-type POTRA domain-containing protein [Desulfatitalea sp.]
MVQVQKGVKNKRSNRFKKDTTHQRARWRGRLWVGLKLTGLMAVLIGFSALFIAGYAAVTRADYFRTQAIEVLGHQRLSTQTILDQAGVRRGENLLGLNLRLVRERLLSHPWIETARVTREIPDTIVIHVSEHVPLARVDLGRHFLINRAGRIFKEVGSDDPVDLPLVTGMAFRDISLGDDALAPAMKAVLTVLQLSEQQRGMLGYDQIARVHLDEAMGVALTLAADQRIVKLGFGQYEVKFARFNRITDHLAQNDRWRHCVAVDLNNPDRVVVQWESAL